MGATPGQGHRRAGARAPGAGPLSRAEVVGAALEIVEAEGVDGLTVRGLAVKLGVAATAIYWHVGDKQALLDAVADRVIAQMGEVKVEGRGPEARLVSVGRSLRRSLLERADLVALVHRQGRTAALFQPARRVLGRELAAAGLEGADAAMAARAVVSLVVGSVLIDRQVERQPAQVDDPGAPRAVDGAELPAEPRDEADLFDYTLGALVRSVVTTPARRP